MNNIGIKFAWVFALSYLLVTAIGFTSNPIIGADGFFVTNTAHNMVHFLTAISFALVAAMGNKASIVFMKVFGVAYIVVGPLGLFVTGLNSEGMLLGLIHVNAWDNLLHFGLGVVFLLAGILGDSYSKDIDLQMNILHR